MSARLPTVLATGAWLKNAACLLESGRAVWSPAHGDLGDPQACMALDRSLDTLLAQATSPVEAIAHDLHPDMYSTQRAIALAGRLGVPALGVQHHHAHIAAVMAEHRLSEPVIGLALDGVGLGTDGLSWGGELLRVAPGDWRRLGHLWPLRLAGGDRAAREPWRMAAAALHALGRGRDIEQRFAGTVGAQAARTVARMLDADLNSPPASSAGRWFDAAAAALGLSVRQSHEAEAAIALESAAGRWFGAHGAAPSTCAIDLPGDGTVELEVDAVLDLRPLLACLFDWPRERIDEAAAWFHLALADGLARWATSAAQHARLGTVCLGGGCFANAWLTGRVTWRLQECGLRVLRPRTVPCGDAGLALGQAWAVAQTIHNAPGVRREFPSCV